MKLSAEITMYPLQDKYLPIIENFIDHLKSYKDITLEVFPTCTDNCININGMKNNMIIHSCKCLV